MENRLQKLCTINFYPHLNLSSASPATRFCCEIEIINELTGAVAWKVYTGETQAKANAKAQAQATKAQNRIARQAY